MLIEAERTKGFQNGLSFSTRMLVRIMTMVVMVRVVVIVMVVVCSAGTSSLLERDKAVCRSLVNCKDTLVAVVLVLRSKERWWWWWL